MKYVIIGNNSTIFITSFSIFSTVIPNFSYIFAGCKSLKDLKPLKNWNVSKGKYFSCMFNRCSSLENIDALNRDPSPV